MRIKFKMYHARPSNIRPRNSKVQIIISTSSSFSGLGTSVGTGGGRLQ